ncbi:transcription activator [Fictibacillus arsenicus]|uniref:Transcription activator n=1 Tax=Fictibacillus arsenicus TaxID=255247 RepID=A0A1B1Z1S7_9BACL|nr:transcription activator [Fictibacillus arsenicus]
MSIRQLEELKLVGFRVLCDGDQYINEIPKASLALQDRIMDIKQVISPDQQIGAFIVDATSETEDGYWVCVQVDKYEDIPEDMISLTVPPQKYAMITHEGSNHDIRNSYERLHEWIMKNNYSRALNKWHIERFLNYENKNQLKVQLFDTIL